MKDIILVNERFVSMGEGRNCGKTRHFIRLHGCNQNCKWCDAKCAWEGHPEGTSPTMVPLEEMAEIINDTNLHVVWTGGEPAIQDNQINEIRKMVDWGLDFDIETNGTIPLTDPEYFDLITVSPKIEWGIEAVIDIMSKYARINSLYDNVIYKFVVDHPDQIKEILARVPVNPEEVYATPNTVKNPDQKDFATKCVNAGINFAPRMQILFDMK